MLKELRNRMLSEMGVGKLLSNKRVFYSTLALVVFFFVYLFASNITQNKAVADTYYVDKFLNLGAKFGNSNRVLIAELDFYRRGGVDRLQAEIPPIDEFLSPEKSYIEEIISHLRNDDLMPAIASFDYTASLLIREKERSLDWIRYVRLAAANIALLLFLFGIVPSILRLSRENDDVDAKSTPAVNIASEGLFALDDNFHIEGVVSSLPFTKLFGQTNDLEGDFFKFISQFVSKEVVQNTKKFLCELDNEGLAKELRKELNPLKRVEIEGINQEGTLAKRYLAFHFERFTDEEESNQLLVSVTDESHLYQLEQELRSTKEEQDAQLELLVSIQKASGSELDHFLEKAEAVLWNLDKSLKSNKKSEVKKEEIEERAQVLADFKTDAGHTGFYKFESLSHSLHDELAELCSNKKITEENCQSSVLILDNLSDELKNIKTIAAKYPAGSAGVVSTSKEIQEELEVEIEDESSEEILDVQDDSDDTVLQLLAKAVSQKHDKKTSLVCYGIEAGNIPDHLDKLVHQIASQLIQNSIIHGCLSADQRLEAGKTDFINVCVRYSQLEDSHVLTVRDDGEGFNREKILKKAAERNLIEEQQIDEIDSQQALRLAFHPEFSIHSDADISNKNVSLSTLRKEIKEAGGRISLRHRAGEFCRFQVTLPK